MDKNGFEIGDRVTHPEFEGHEPVIKEFVDGYEVVAVFEGGGFWRVSQLQHATPS